LLNQPVCLGHRTGLGQHRLGTINITGSQLQLTKLTGDAGKLGSVLVRVSEQSAPGV